MANLFGVMIQSAISKIDSIKQNHGRFTLSGDVIKSNLSIDYSTIKLKKECKIVQLYYSGETIAAYRKMLNEYQKIIDDPNLKLDDIMNQINAYVNGWSTLKIISDQNLTMLDSMIARRHTKLQNYHASMNDLMDDFQSKNKEVVEMVDRITIPLYKYTTEFPYRRAYAYFFKKQRVHESLVQGHIEDDIQYLDDLINKLNILYAGWEKSGKDEAFERYREIQRRLILSIQSFADVLELDITLYEKMIALNETVINFKVYPK